MPVVPMTRADLFSQAQAAQILGCHKHTVGDNARDLGIGRKKDPTRPNALLLDREDIERLAAAVGKSIDWDSVIAA